MPEHKYQRWKIQVRLNETRKAKELAAIAEVQDQYPILSFAFRQSMVSSNHECLVIEFLAQFGEQSFRFVVELIPSAKFPYEEPAAVVLEPDLRGLPPGLHTYSDREFAGRLICAHLSGWSPRSSLMQFFVAAVNPWANNFLAWVITKGEWSPKQWFTTEGRAT